MRYLLISILYIVCIGCGVAVVDEYTTLQKEGASIENPYFSNPAEDYVYKANITFYGNELSGILIIKKIDKDTHRLLCTTQFGNTLFDIEFTKGGYTVRSVIDDLNKKIILNTLIRDFDVLLKEHRIVTTRYTNAIYEVRKNKEKKRYHYYYYKKPEGVLSKIVHTTKNKNKFTIQFVGVKGNLVEQIQIKHQNIKLAIQLQTLKK